MTRFQVLEKGGEEPALPDIDGAEFLAEWLMDIGPVDRGGMGATGLTFAEIAAWSATTGIPLRDGEAAALKAMSAAYAGELHRASGENVKAPFEP